MSSDPTSAALSDALNLAIPQLPTPIAVCLDRVLAASSAHDQWREICTTVEQLLRFAALPLLATYLHAKDQPPDEKLNGVFLNLREVSFDKWRSATRALAIRRDFFMETCPWYFTPFLNAAELIADTLKFREERNFGAHSVYRHQLSRGFTERVEELTPHFLQLLKAYSFLKSLSFLAVDQREPGRLYLFRGMSPTTQRLEMPNPLGANVWVQGANDQRCRLNPLVLLNETDKFLELFDGFRLAAQEQPEKDAVFFQSLSKGFTRYSGPAGELRQLCRNRRIELGLRPTDVRPWTLAETCLDRSWLAVQNMRETVYRSESLVQRPVVQHAFLRFLSPENEACPAMVVAGSFGTGKSSLLVSLVELLLLDIKNGVSDDIVLFLRGSDLSAGSQNSAGHTFLGDLFRLIDIRYDGIARLREVFLRLEGDLKLDNSPRRRLIMVFDGVEEAPNSPHAVFQRLLEMVHEIKEYPWVRLIISARVEFLDSHELALGSGSPDPVRETHGLFFTPDDTIPEEYHWPKKRFAWKVPNMDIEQAEELYVKYQRLRERDILQGRSPKEAHPACQVPWNQIDVRAREQLLTRPLYLDIWMRAFSDTLPPDNLHLSADLFDAHGESVTRRYPSLEREVLTPLIVGMMRQGKQVVYEDDFPSLHINRTTMIKAMDSGIYVFYTDPWSNRPYYRIFHERMAEVMFARVLSNQINSVITQLADSSQAWTEIARRWSDFPMTPLLVRGASYLAYRNLKRELRADITFQVLDQFDWQLPPNSSLFYREGLVRESVEMREGLRKLFVEGAIAKVSNNLEEGERRNLYALGNGYLRLDERQKAFEAFDGALRLSPRGADPIVAAVWMYRSTQSLKFGEFDEALRELNRAQQSAGDTRLQGNIMGHIARCLLKRLGPPPQSWWPPNLWARLVRLVTLKRIVNLLREAIRISREDPPDERSAIFWTVMLGEVYIEQGRPQDAISLLMDIRRECEAGVPDSLCLMFLYGFLAIAQRTIGQCGTAEELLREAKRLAELTGDHAKYNEMQATYDQAAASGARPH